MFRPGPSCDTQPQATGTPIWRTARLSSVCAELPIARLHTMRRLSSRTTSHQTQDPSERSWNCAKHSSRQSTRSWINSPSHSHSSRLLSSLSSFMATGHWYNGILGTQAFHHGDCTFAFDFSYTYRIPHGDGIHFSYTLGVPHGDGILFYTYGVPHGDRILQSLPCDSKPQSRTRVHTVAGSAVAVVPCL